ncbi:cGMP-dependent 3',5'-cyclic phosphodiesterase [Chamberlinius hualienensis]
MFNVENLACSKSPSTVVSLGNVCAQLLLTVISSTLDSSQNCECADTRMELGKHWKVHALLNLCGNLHDQDAASLQLKINRYLIEQTKSETAFLIFVSEDGEELYCQVTGDKILPEEIKFPINNNSFSTALAEKRTITLDDIHVDHRDNIRKMVGVEISSLLCVPIATPTRKGKVTLLGCLINKNGADRFNSQDELVIEECFKYTAAVLLNTLAYEEEKRLKLQCQSLLTVAKNLFSHLDDVTKLLKEIMAEARQLTKAERCSLFLLDKEHGELVAKVFDGNLADDNHENGVEVRFSADRGIAGHVAMSGELLNIRDVYSHPLFYRGVDESTGFKTRNILCFPIKDDKDVIGIAELCNKIGGLHFSHFDEEIALAFSIYCGISIMHSLMYKKVRDAQYRSRLSNELMTYHMLVPQEEVIKLSSKRIPDPCEISSGFQTYAFLPRSIEDSQSPLAVVAMFEDLGMMNKCRVGRETLARFILMVKKGYRDPPYHNWSHAFSATHFCYLLLRNLSIVKQDFLTEIEALSLFIAVMCHDLDHRGTTNSFQETSKSVLAALYSSEGSVMERHHFAQAMCILNTDGCNIFENLSSKDYTHCLDLMRDIILATDLAQHLRIVKDLREFITSGYDKSNAKHHKYLVCLLMTACDVSDQTKDWRCSKKIAELVYKEFFSQGDLEKAMGNRPSEMMDREKACIPELQISFINHIVLPVFEILSSIFPAAKTLLQAVTLNKMFWQRMGDVYRQRYTVSTSSLDIFDDDELEREVLSVSNHMSSNNY